MEKLLERLKANGLISTDLLCWLSIVLLILVHHCSSRTHPDISQLKTDMSTIRADIDTMKTDVATIKTDVAILKANMAEIKARLSIRD